jgi:hypothetical protein
LRLINAGAHDGDSNQRLEADAYSSDASPTQNFAFVIGAVALCGFVFFLKGLYSGGYVMLFGGWLLAAIAFITVRYLSGHFPIPFAERVSTGAGIDASATCYSTSENVRVLAVVIPELKLRNIKRVGRISEAYSAIDISDDVGGLRLWATRYNQQSPGSEFIFVASGAPSTTLRVVPLPRYRGGGKISSSRRTSPTI